MEPPSARSTRAAFSMAPALMILSGVVALLSCGRRYVRLGVSQMIGWPCVALMASFEVGFALSSGVQWSSLWWALVLKGLAVSLVFGVVLCLAERRKLSRWMWTSPSPRGATRLLD